MNYSANLNRLEAAELCHGETVSIAEAGIREIIATGYVLEEKTNRDGGVYIRLIFRGDDGLLYSTGSNSCIESLPEIIDIMNECGLEWPDGIRLKFARKKSSLDSTRSYLIMWIAAR